MKDGIAFGGFEIEGLRVWNQETGRSAIGILEDVEICAFRACVVNIQKQSLREFLLDVEIPDLDVAELIVAIHGVAVRDGAGGRSREAAGKRKRNRGGFDVRFGERERRLKGELLNDAVVGAGVEIDAVAGANDRVLQWLPGDAEARGDVVRSEERRVGKEGG